MKDEIRDEVRRIADHDLKRMFEDRRKKEALEPPELILKIEPEPRRKPA